MVLIAASGFFCVSLGKLNPTNPKILNNLWSYIKPLKVQKVCRFVLKEHCKKILMIPTIPNSKKV